MVGGTPPLDVTVGGGDDNDVGDAPPAAPPPADAGGGTEPYGVIGVDAPAPVAGPAAEVGTPVDAVGAPVSGGGVLVEAGAADAGVIALTSAGSAPLWSSERIRLWVSSTLRQGHLGGVGSRM